mgnify:CR=1 FL=1
MNITAVIIAAVIVGGTGLFIGVFLGLAGKKFAVEVDEREEAILGVLPGNNCGGTPLSFTFSTMFPQCLQIQYLTSMPFSPSMCKIYNSIVSIIFFNESADSLSFNASSPLKLIGISDSIPSAPTIAGILNDTPSISYTP